MAGRKKGGTSVAPEKRKIGRQISMDEQEWQEIDEEAQKRGLSRSALIRLAIKNFCKEKPV